MGVNMAGLSIIDDEVCREASKQEIIRRYFKTAWPCAPGLASEAELQKIENLMRQLKLEPENRPVVLAALKRAGSDRTAAAALELRTARL